MDSIIFKPVLSCLPVRRFSSCFLSIYCVLPCFVDVNHCKVGGVSKTRSASPSTRSTQPAMYHTVSFYVSSPFRFTSPPTYRPPARSHARSSQPLISSAPDTQLTHAHTHLLDEEKLQPSLTRFFRRLAPDTPVSRTNWLIQVLPPSSDSHTNLEELAWAEGGVGPEETFRTTPRPAPPPPIPERIRLRVERQTLRRLPRSGAVVFTIRVYLTPLAELGNGEAGRLAAAIRGVKEQEVVHRCVPAAGPPLFLCWFLR